MANQCKYKILINGRNTNFVTDFIQYTETYFKCLSTTDCFVDIANHFELFPPDAYVVFTESRDSKLLTQTNPIKEHPFYNGAPIIVICDENTSKELEYTARCLVDLLVKRPISADNLALRIIRFFEERGEAPKYIEQAAPARQMRNFLDTEEEAPRAEALTMAREAIAPAPAAPAEKKNILVVDDDRTILKMLKAALEERYDVTTMVNGIMVEKFIESRQVDLVILDYEMPVETGAEIFRKLKNNPKATNIPVCFLTGVSERDKILEIMSLKPHGYLLKPIDMDMLLSTVSGLTEE